MRKIIGACLVVVLCLVSVGCFNPCGSAKFAVVIRHGPQLPQFTRRILGVTPSTESGHVYASDPWAENRAWYAWAEVTDSSGAKLTNPAVNWSTDIAECVRLQGLGPERRDAVMVRSFDGSSMGRGKVYAEYEGTVASMDVYAYGFVWLECDSGHPVSAGWSFATQTTGGDDLAIRIDPSSPSGVVIWAPHGIQQIGDASLLDEDAYFEQFTAPATGPFVTEAVPSGIFDIIGADGTHYKLAAPVTEHLYDSGGNNWYRVHFTWDYYR